MKKISISKKTLSPDALYNKSFGVITAEEILLGNQEVQLSWEGWDLPEEEILKLPEVSEFNEGFFKGQYTNDANLSNLHLHFLHQSQPNLPDPNLTQEEVDTFSKKYVPNLRLVSQIRDQLSELPYIIYQRDTPLLIPSKEGASLPLFKSKKLAHIMIKSYKETLTDKSTKKVFERQTLISQPSSSKLAQDISRSRFLDIAKIIVWTSKNDVFYITL